MTGALRPAAFALALVAVAAIACGGGRRETAPREDWSAAPAASTPTLAAGVTFDGMQISTENRGAERWRDVLIEVRRDATSRSFRYRADVIVEGRRLPMGALNFEAADGHRLSPFEGAPTEWRISATLPDGRRGVASGRVEAVSPK